MVAPVILAVWVRSHPHSQNYVPLQGIPKATVLEVKVSKVKEPKKQAHGTSFNGLARGRRCASIHLAGAGA